MQQSWYLSGKCPRVLVLKKIVNSTQTFPLAFDVTVVPLHKLSSLIYQTAIILKDLNSSFFIREKKKIIIIIILNLFFCGEYVNLYYIHIYADFTFLVSACILNDDCISKKSKNFHQVCQAHVKNCELRWFRTSLKNYANFISDLMQNL